MTKQTDLQKELQEKLKLGIKPSQLKRSKSAESLTPNSEKLADLQKALTVQENTNSLLNSENIRLQQELTFSQTNASNYLTNLQQTTAELDNSKEQLKALEATNNSLVDKNNELRLQALKDFSLVRENQQGIEQAVEKLVNTEQTQINFQVQNKQLLREKTDLENRLKTAEARIQKLYQLKGLPHTAKQPFTFSLKTVLITSLLVGGTVYFLT